MCRGRRPFPSRSRCSARFYLTGSRRSVIRATRPKPRLQFVACPMIEIASRELRRAIADGMSIRYMVPRAVEEYIRDRKLYAAR